MILGAISVNGFIIFLSVLGEGALLLLGVFLIVYIFILLRQL